MNIREIKQLYVVSKHFLDLSSEIFSHKLNEDDKNLTNSDIAKHFEKNEIEDNIIQISILNAYLSSAAIRLTTIYESLNLKPNIKKLYNSKFELKNLHFYLRDNVCHREPYEDQYNFIKRQEFIESCTIKEMYNTIKEILDKCKDDLIRLEDKLSGMNSFLKENHLKIRFYNGSATFSYKDYADHDKQKTITLIAAEFIRQFLLHILPKGFMRIRAYRFFSNKAKK